MNKVYTRINWENYPSEKTAVNESNLNKMDSALYEIDTRVVEHETTKANVSSLNELINYWHIDETTGVITIHKVSGEQIIFDLNIEKVPVGFSMTDDGILIMTTDDGTEFTANIGSMIPILTFNDSEQIAVAVSGEGVNKTYTFTIKTGSITEDKLQPNFLADCRLYAGNAENSALRAEEYAEKAEENAEKYQNIISVINQASKSWIMTTDTEITYQGIGAPSIAVVSGSYYLDVVTGNVYLGETEWTLDRTLTSVQNELETIQRKMPKVVATNVTLTNGKATVYMNQLVETGIQRVLSVSGFGQDVLPTFYVSSGAYSDYRIVIYASNFASSASASARVAINYIEY